MKSTSHKTLGFYLIDHYLKDYSPACRTAFNLGCIQPDKNPTTYLKGSFRCQWLRGHNWGNANRYIAKLGNRLQSKKSFNILRFYQLGKLIHYTADAFTYAHNQNYQENLTAHRDYEIHLHNALLDYLTQLHDHHSIQLDPDGSISGFIIHNHRKYMKHAPCVENDMEYCVRMCAQVLQLMLQSKSLAYA